MKKSLKDRIDKVKGLFYFLRCVFFLIKEDRESKKIESLAKKAAKRYFLYLHKAYQELDKLEKYLLYKD